MPDMWGISIELSVSRKDAEDKVTVCNEGKEQILMQSLWSKIPCMKTLKSSISYVHRKWWPYKYIFDFYLAQSQVNVLIVCLFVCLSVCHSIVS